MFFPCQLLHTVFLFSLLLEQTLGRDKWLERKNRIPFQPRHLGYENSTCLGLDCAHFPDLMMNNVLSDSSTSSISYLNVSSPDICDCNSEFIPTVTISGTVSATASATDAITVIIGGGAVAPSATSIPSESNSFTASVGAATSIIIVSLASRTASSTTSTSAVSSPTYSTGNSFGNLGSCPTPQIKFGVGFDDKAGTSFEAVDRAFFNHASSDFDTIASFICSTLQSCGADETAQNTCDRAKISGDSEPSGTGNQADAFNAEFGIETDFASVQPVDSNSSTTQDITSSQPEATATSTVSTSDSSSFNSATSTTTESDTAAPTSTAGPSQTDNLQTFTGSLGDVTAPAVRDLNNGQFQVDGDSKFNSKKEALSRSCDIQHNQCADAANASKNKDFSVHDCDTQEQSCDAASG